jgi:hypothetical protein
MVLYIVAGKLGWVRGVGSVRTIQAQQLVPELTR